MDSRQGKQDPNPQNTIRIRQLERVSALQRHRQLPIRERKTIGCSNHLRSIKRRMPPVSLSVSRSLTRPHQQPANRFSINVLT